MSLLATRSVIDGIDTCLPPEMFADLKDVFANHCTDGLANAPQLLNFLKSIGESVTAQELKDIMSEVDGDSSGVLDFPQTVKMMENIMSQWDFKERILEAFKVFDSDDSGTISPAELKNILTTLEQKMSDEDADELIKAAQNISKSAWERDGPYNPECILYESFATAMHDLIVKPGKKAKGKKGSKKGKKKKK